jgi:hypothetical protein
MRYLINEIGSHHLKRGSNVEGGSCEVIKRERENTNCMCWRK